MGNFTPTPSAPTPCKTSRTFRKKFRKNSGRTPEALSERFLEFPSRVRLGCPKPYNSRHLRLPEHFQNSLPPQYGRGRLFFQKWFRRGPLGAGHGIPGSTEGVSEDRHPSKTAHSDRTPCKGSTLGRFLVNFLVNFGQPWLKPTKNRPKTDSKLTLSRVPTGVYP